MNTVNLKINNIPVVAPEGTTILEAAHLVGIRIPTLCYLKEINAIGACRMCVVEQKGARSNPVACLQQVAEGMEVQTNTPALRASRKTTLELLLSNHRMDCLTCARNAHCELRELAAELGIDAVRYANDQLPPQIEDSAAHLIRDNSKCVLCRRCTAVCRKYQEVGVIGPNDRGFATHIGPSFDSPLSETACIHCGQCIIACPTGALYEKDNTGLVWNALGDPQKHVVVQTAPSVRAGLGEMFSLPIGTNVEGKLAAALRRLGFDGVFDTDFAADLTIIEEATELIGRIQKGGALPLITSCSPGWIKYCEHYFPDMTENLSTCKSPQQMFGAVVKTFFAEKMGWDPQDIFFVSAIPCTAKKFEVGRDDQSAAGNGIPDVDVAITTRELGRMIQKAGIDFRSLDDEHFDAPFAIGSGAGAIFGATGGVMEAALRYAAELILGTRLESVDFPEVRGTEGIKLASYKLGDLTVNVGVASSTGKAKELLNRVKSGELDLQFIEIMGCPGGCVNGGGQPIQPAHVRATIDLRAVRAAVLYNDDRNDDLRKSQDNTAVKMLYDEFFGYPNSEKAHHILHTSYVKRGL